MKTQEETLKNKMKTLFIDSPGSQAATVQVWFRAGSALEKKEDHGVAHFLEHMFFKGTPKRPGAQIAHEIESFGGEVNAFTSFDYTCYYINTPNTKLVDSVDILLDMVANPEFKNEELLPERDVVHEEYKRSYDNPAQFRFLKIQEQCFGKGYNHGILGKPQNIKNFTRDQIINFRNKYYNLENSLFVVAGDLSQKNRIKDKIESFKLPSGETGSFPRFKLKDFSKDNIHHKDVNQTTLSLSLQALNYDDPMSPAEELALNCLCHGEISPLYKSLVTESSLANSIGGSTMFLRDGGIHLIRMSLPNENLKKALRRFNQVLKLKLKTGFTPAELERIRNQFLSSKIYEKETIDSYAFSLGHSFAQSGDIHSEEEYLSRISKVSATEAHLALKNIFTRFVHLTLQVPKGVELKKAQNELELFRSSFPRVEKSKSLITKGLKHSRFDPKVKVLEVKKGIQFVYRHNDMTPTFTLQAYLKGGIFSETESDNGIHYLLSRILTYGHKKADFEKLKLELETKSAYLNGFSGKNAYGLTIHGLSKDFAKLSEHFRMTLLEAKFPSSYFKLNKELALRQIHIKKQDPVKTCFQQVNRSLFKGHPYALDVIGSEKTLKRISLRAVKDLHAKKLKSSPLVLTYCGDLPFEEVYTEVKKLTAPLKGRPHLPFRGRKLLKTQNAQIQIPFDREQSHLFIGKRSYKTATTEDLFLKMLTSHLQGQSSKLFTEVRDKRGLCYTVQPVHHMALDTGYWGVYIGTSRDKAKEASYAIKELLSELARKGLNQTEFNRVKKVIEGQNLLNIQTNDDFANFYSIPMLHQLGIDYQHISFEKMRNFTHDQFNSFLAKFLNGQFLEVTVG